MAADRRTFRRSETAATGPRLIQHFTLWSPIASLSLKSSGAALLRLPIRLFSVKPGLIMKSAKTKFVVISAFGLASIVGIFVSAQTPTPSKTSGQELPVHLLLTCANVTKAKLVTALSPRPSATYRFKIGNDTIGTLPADTSLPPCPGNTLSGNSTQKATFNNTKELRTFLDAAGL